MRAKTDINGAITLAKTFSEFLDSCKGKRSDFTITGYRTAMKSFAAFAQRHLGLDSVHFNITCFTEQNVNRYLEWLRRDHGASPQTCNLRLCQIRAFLKHASKEPSVMPHYLSLRKMKRYITENRTKVVEPLSKTVISALMKTPGTDTDTGLRYTLLIAMLYTMALRIDEALSVKIRDMRLDAVKPYVTVVGKGRKSRTVYFMKATLKILRRYIINEHGRTPDPDAYLFYARSAGPFSKVSGRGVNKQLCVYAAEARKSCPEVPERIHTHQFRHSMATHLLEDGMNVFQISKMLGHESVETTMTYLGVTVSMTEKAIRTVESTTAKSIKPIWKKNISQLQDLF